MKTGINPLKNKIKRIKKQMLFVCKCKDLSTQEKVDITAIYIKLIGVYNKRLQTAINVIEVVE